MEHNRIEKEVKKSITCVRFYIIQHSDLLNKSYIIRWNIHEGLLTTNSTEHCAKFLCEGENQKANTFFQIMQHVIWPLQINFEFYEMEI